MAFPAGVHGACYPRAHPEITHGRTTPSPFLVACRLLPLLLFIPGPGRVAAVRPLSFAASSYSATMGAVPLSSRSSSGHRRATIVTDAAHVSIFLGRGRAGLHGGPIFAKYGQPCPRIGHHAVLPPMRVSGGGGPDTPAAKTTRVPKAGCCESFVMHDLGLGSISRYHMYNSKPQSKHLVRMA